MTLKYTMITLLIAGLYLWCSNLLNQIFNIVFFHPLYGLLGILLWLAFGVIFYSLVSERSFFPLSIAIFGGLIGMTIFLCFFQLLFLLGIITFNVRFFSVYANITLILFISMIIFLIDRFFKDKKR